MIQAESMNHNIVFGVLPERIRKSLAEEIIILLEENRQLYLQYISILNELDLFSRFMERANGEITHKNLNVCKIYSIRFLIETGIESFISEHEELMTIHDGLLSEQAKMLEQATSYFSEK